MNIKFVHKVLIQVTNLTIKAVMVSLTVLAASGIGYLITELLSNPSSFDNVGSFQKGDNSLLL